MIYSQCMFHKKTSHLNFLTTSTKWRPIILRFFYWLPTNRLPPVPCTTDFTDNHTVSISSGQFLWTRPVGCEVLWWVCPFVCLSVCLSVCLPVSSHNSKATRPNFTKFFCMLPMALARSSSDVSQRRQKRTKVARSSSDGVALRYVLPVYKWRLVFIPWSQWAESSMALCL